MLNFNQNLRSAFALAALMLLSISGLLAQCAAGTPTVVTVAQPTLSACPGSTASTSIMITGTSQVTVTAPNGTRTVYQRDANYRVSIPAYNIVVGPGTVGTYVVSAASCCAFSNCQAGFATFTVNSTFPITQQPISQAICGNTTRFSVVANPNGGTLSYQWRYNGTNLTNGGNISGANINDLTISNATSANVGSYNCIITSSACPNSFSSNTVTLVANTPLSVTQSTLVPICGNNYEIINVTATGGTANQTSYQWYANGSPIQFATVAQVNFPTPANPTSYYCVVSNTGSCNVVTTTPQTISFSALPTISGPTTVQCGSATLTVTDGASYRWDDLSTGSTFTTTATGTYRVTATGSNGCTATLSRSVTVSHATGLSVTIPTNVCASALVSVTNASSWSAFSWNGNFSNQSTQNYTANGTYQVTANDASGCPASHTFTISNIVAVGYTITGGGCQATTITASPGFASYSWANNYRFPPRPTVTTQLGTAQVLVLDVSLFAGNVVLYATATQGCTVTNSFPYGLVDTYVASISIAPPPVISCATPITLAASHQPSSQTMSYVWSDGATTAARTANTAGVYSVTGTSNTGCTYTTSVAVSASVGTASITQQPTSQTACSGAALSLSVAASNPTGYQWRRNGVNLPGATSSSLNITATQLSDAGSYDVVVNGCTGGVTSTAVSVTIVNAGITQQPASQVLTCAAAVPATFTVQTSSTPISYQWRYNGNNITNNAVYSGATSATLTIASGTTAEFGNYDCVIAFSCGSVTTTAAVLSSLQSSSLVQYPFNNNLTDASGNGRNGTGAVVYTADRNGVANGAISLNGTTSQVVTAPAANYFGGGSFTAATWFKIDAYALYARLFDFGNGSGNNNVVAYINASGIVSVVYMNGATSSSTLSTPSSVPLNTWTHFAWVQNGLTASLYINGSLVASQSNMVQPFPNISRSNCYIGLSNWANDPKFRGAFDDFTIMNRSLSAAEISALQGNITISQQPVSVAACPNQPATLSVTAPSAVAYQWQLNGTNIPNATSSTFTTNGTPASLGVYRVLVSSACSSGLSNNASVTAITSAPTVSIATPATLTCANSQVTLNASGASSYVWTNGPSTASYAVTAAGSYNVVGTSANGCTASASVNVVSNANAPTVSIATPATLTCANAQVMLNASGASSYMWANGPSTASYAVTSAGSYTVVGTGANGCTAFASVNVVSNANGPTVSIATPFTLTCANTTVNLIASGGASYLWSNGLSGAVAVVSSAGSYTVTTTGANGCTATASATVVADNTIATPVIIANNNELSTSGGVSYRWLQGGNVIPNATSATYTATQNGSYVVEITGANGCTATSAPFTVTGVGIESLESIGVSIYPNPTNGALFIAATMTIESVELFDMLGHSIQLPSADYSQLDITSLTNGMYIVKAKLTDGRTGYTRILKH